MNEEAEQRIAAAQADARRQKETQEFLRGLKSGDELMKPIYNPEAFVMRNKARAAASRGEIPHTPCRHPLQNLSQFIDDDPAVKRQGRPVNLFECGICHLPLWLVDPWGEAVSDD